MKKKLYEISKISFEHAENVEEAIEIAKSSNNYKVLEVREVKEE